MRGILALALLALVFGTAVATAQLLTTGAGSGGFNPTVPSGKILVTGGSVLLVSAGVNLLVQ